MVLERIPTNEGRRTLVTCALVATWWTGPSQRRLFSSVKIDQSNYERWMNGVVRPGSKDRLLGHVRSMWHSISPFAEYDKQILIQVLPGISGEYLSLYAISVASRCALSLSSTSVRTGSIFVSQRFVRLSRTSPSAASPPRHLVRSWLSLIIFPTSQPFNWSRSSRRDSARSAFCRSLGHPRGN